jgi:hypothetical protein
MMASLPRPGTSIMDPAGPVDGLRPWAVGYVSARGPVEPGAWTGWHCAVEAHAVQMRLPMLHVFSDDQSSGTAGFAAMLGAMRQRAHLRSGYLGVVVVPALDHLSPVRDGSESVTALLLRLHFDVTVQTAYQRPAPAAPHPLAGRSAGAEEFIDLLLGIRTGPVPLALPAREALSGTPMTGGFDV